VPGRVAIERGGRLPSERELQLAELERLEATPRLEPAAKRQELERRHGLEHVDLRHHDLEDREHALQRPERARHVVTAEHRAEIVQLVKHLLEPQLVDLMDDDEQRLVVLGSVRQAAAGAAAARPA
jgi:hypothetical protein